MKFGLLLAGGLGKRMDSSIPKVLHEINKIPMICYVINTAFKIGCNSIGIIVGKYKQIIIETISKFYPNDSRINWIDQEEPLGTGHAVLCGLQWMQLNLDPMTNVLILSGDVPLISTFTLENLMNKPNSILVTKLENPYGYGRVRVCLAKQSNTVKRIIEEKDCTPEEKLINLVNCGIYSMELSLLANVIPLITNDNAAKEYYLTDMIKLSYSQDQQINWYELSSDKSIEIANINTKEDLENIKLLIT